MAGAKAARAAATLSALDTLRARASSRCITARDKLKISSTLELEINQFATTVNRSELAESIACWTAFWPGYLVSLVLGDVLTEICRRCADVFVALTGGFVKRTFARALGR